MYSTCIIILASCSGAIKIQIEKKRFWLASMLASYVGYVEFVCWFSTLLREVFLRVLQFSRPPKNQHFRISTRSRNARTFLNEFM